MVSCLGYLESPSRANIPGSAQSTRNVEVPRALTIAILWTGLEVFRGEVIWDGYAWFLVCHPLIDLGWPFTSAATGLGAYFVSFCLVGMVAGITQAITISGRGRFSGIVAAVACLVAWCTVGAIAASQMPRDRKPETVRVAVVQTNLPQNNKESRWPIEDQIKDFERWLDLTRRAAQGPGGASDRGADLIIWPETMFPGLALNDEAEAVERRAEMFYRLPAGAGVNGADRLPSTYFRDRLLALQAQLRIPMLVGAVAMEGLKITRRDDGRLKFDHAAKYNSAFLIRDGKVEPTRYDKIELMAFGETVPHVGAMPWAKKLVSDLSGTGWVFDLDAGARPVLFDLALPVPGGAAPRAVAFATPICFEGTMPRVLSRFLASRSPSGLPPAFVVSITNDGWFGSGNGGREQHLLTMRWRAVESGLAVVRAANTGVSAAIGPDGSILDQTRSDNGVPALALGPVRQESVLIADLPLPPSTGTAGFLTFSRLGNAFGWVCAIITGVLVVGMLLQSALAGRKTQKMVAASSDPPRSQ